VQALLAPAVHYASRESRGGEVRSCGLRVPHPDIYTTVQMREKTSRSPKKSQNVPRRRVRFQRGGDLPMCFYNVKMGRDRRVAAEDERLRETTDR
jgi:hypothetical protein